MEKTKSLNDYIEILLRRKWLLIIPAVLGLSMGVLASFILPSYYRSTTVIIVEQQQVPEKYVMPADVTPIEKRLHTIGQQIISRQHIEQIISDLNLDKKFEKDQPHGILAIPLRLTGYVSPGPSNKEDLIAWTKRNIDVKISEGRMKKGADAFSISYSDRNPYTAMQVTSALASLFIEENLKIREQSVEGTSEFLQSEVEKAKLNLEVQEKALRSFKEQHMGSLPEQVDANLRTLDRLQMELQSMRASLKAAEDKMDVLEAQLGVGGKSPAGSSLEGEIEKLKGELTYLLSIYKESYPDVIMTRTRISELESKLTREAAAQKTTGSTPSAPRGAASAELMSIASQISTLKQRESDIVSQIRQFERRVESTPSNEQKLSDIRRDYEISFDNYKSLLEKKLNARLAENLEKWQKGERFRVIDPPNLPERPYKPDKAIITLGGLLAGAGAGTGLILILEFMNPAFRKPEEIEEFLNQPVLAVIPVFLRDNEKKPAGKLRYIRKAAR